MTSIAMTKTDVIRDLNDAFRRTFVGGAVVVTSGVEALSPDQRAGILMKVRGFDAFTDDNDPHGEHDFGAVDLDGHCEDASSVQRSPKAALRNWDPDDSKTPYRGGSIAICSPDMVSDADTDRAPPFPRPGGAPDTAVSFASAPRESTSINCGAILASCANLS
jgi:Protein of unknown function (DUF3768)